MNAASKRYGKFREPAVLASAGLSERHHRGRWKRILSIEPIEIRIRYEAALAAKRLKVMGEWIDQGHETHHQSIFTAIGQSKADNVASDRIPETRLEANCGILIPDIHSCSTDPLNQIPMGLYCYTDGWIIIMEARNNFSIFVF
ncbi:hypothetical protein EVAR_72868_1 [Eumeta japonica]|uniref:Uncharacterized protein n=1 Tax=Eumeta variegata TaxID=151549 RepID=A0A4C1SQX8_EUMVA|nr:hypothetical protein EVAR_72868_1 [Eumeta japonica]